MRQKHDILKDFYFRKYYLKYEIKKLILKSILQTNSLPLTNKTAISLKYNSISRKTNICRQINKCMLTGRSKGVYQFINLSRHRIKKLNNLGLIQNIKVAG
jgi:small subunit ribosomal protein S14